MSKEDFVGSHKGKVKHQKVISQPKQYNQAELFHIDDSFFEKTYNDFSINFKCMDVEKYIKALSIPIHLVVTSPPYNCNIKYDSHDDNMAWVDYEKWLSRVFKLIFKKIVDGGRVVLNFPIFIKNEGGRKSLCSVFEAILISAGFELMDYITWVKAKDEKEAIGTAGRSTAWGSWLSPSSPNARPISELILIAKKPGKYLSENKESTITVDEFKASTISAWFFNGASSKYHPATFPPELAIRAINLYSYKHDNVLDPFMGIGSSAVGCLRTHRNFYGCDISKNYVRAAASRITNG